MRLRDGSLQAWMVLAAFATPLLHAATPPDRIFRSGFTQALVIEGSAGYPGPLAKARVEAHFGEMVASATSSADGTFQIGLEVDQIDPGAIVELVARGTGTQSHLVWASPLGPASRLLELGGDRYRVGFADDPFVHLSPRSTVATAAARAFNGWQPITDAATFWRAVRSRQQVTDDLVSALALVARGALVLPDGADDTFAAVSALAPSKTLRSSYRTLGETANCSAAPTSDFCDVTANLPLDARMFPPVAWAPGELYSAVDAFGTTAEDVGGIAPNETGATVLTGYAGNTQAVAATAIRLPDGGYELTPEDGGVFYSFPSWRYVDGSNTPVPTREEATSIYFRLTQGAGGQVEFVSSDDRRTVYPDNPEIPDSYTPYYRSLMPAVSASNPLPPALLGTVPSLAGSRFVLPSPLSRPQDASVDASLHGYDIHAFGVADGNAERSGQPFTFQVTSPDSFAIDSNGRHAEFRFFNEEEPDVWRVRMHVTGANFENIVTGLLIPADAGALTAATVVGSWRSRLPGDTCLGPYSDLGACRTSLMFTFEANGTGTRESGSTLWTGTWSMATGNDAGRLLFEWWYPYNGSPFLYERRGWELVHATGANRWVLENVNIAPDDGDDVPPPPPPVVFNPTTRLIRYDRQ